MIFWSSLEDSSQLLFEKASTAGAIAVTAAGSLTDKLAHVCRGLDRRILGWVYVGRAIRNGAMGASTINDAAAPFTESIVSLILSDEHRKAQAWKRGNF